MKFYCLFLVCLPAFLSAQEFDVSSTDFNAGTIVPLRGEWRFYWDTLFIPNQNTALVHQTVHVPNYWSAGNPGEYGKATYYARVNLGNQAIPKALHIPYVRCAAQVFVDGKIVGRLGRVGDKENYQSKLSSLFTTLPDTGTVDLVIQVANYENLWAGLSSTPTIGYSPALQTKYQIKTGLDLIFVGCLLAMAIYLITMYFLYREGFGFLFLALICLAVLLRSLTTESSSLLLPMLFPNSGWSIWKKMEFFSVYSVVALLPLYVSHMFRTESNKKIDYFFIGLATLLCSTVLIAPHSFFASILDVAHVGLLLGFIYAVIIVTKALRKKNPDARTLLIGILAAFPFIMMEMLKNSALQVPIPLTHLVELGVLIFLLFQVYVLANHYASTYRDLSQEVKRRTAELTQSNEINSRMLAILSHDVKGPVNSLKAVMSMFNQGQLNEQELKPLAREIEAQAGSISLMIENVLLWVRAQIKGIEVSWEVFDLAEWVNPHLDLYGIQAKSRGIKLITTIPKQIMVRADKQVISLTTRNLVSNAIKFAYEGSEVIISAQQLSGNVVLTFSNMGMGMPPEQVQSVFQNTKAMESKTSTGLGLKLCRSYLLAMGTDFMIESVPNNGTTVSALLEPSR